VRLFVRLIVRACPVGTVITTGDQPAGVVAVRPGVRIQRGAGRGGRRVGSHGQTATIPHIGTVEPSGRYACRPRSQIDHLLAEGHNRRGGSMQTTRSAASREL